MTYLFYQKINYITTKTPQPTKELLYRLRSKFYFFKGLIEVFKKRSYSSGDNLPKSQT